MPKDLSTLIVSSSFQRLLQIDPDDINNILDGTGSVYLIPTSSIQNWNTAVNSAVDSLGYITEDGVVFTTKPNTGSILLQGNILVDGNVSVFSGSTETVTMKKEGYLKLSNYQEDLSTAEVGSMVYKDNEFYLITI
jgi:hypothetical protein